MLHFPEEYDLDGINVDIEELSNDAEDGYIQFIRELSIQCLYNLSEYSDKQVLYNQDFLKSLFGYLLNILIEYIHLSHLLSVWILKN